MDGLLLSAKLCYADATPQFLGELFLTCNVKVIPDIYNSIFYWIIRKPEATVLQFLEVCKPYFKLDIDYFNRLFGDFNAGWFENRHEENILCLKFILEHCYSLINDIDSYNTFWQVILKCCENFGIVHQNQDNYSQYIRTILEDFGKALFGFQPYPYRKFSHEPYLFPLNIQTVGMFISHFKKFLHIDMQMYDFGLTYSCITTYFKSIQAYQALATTQRKRQIQQIISSELYEDLAIIIVQYLGVVYY